MDKQKIRKKMIHDRLLYLPEDLKIANDAIYQKLINHPWFVKAQTIGIYVSYKNEVDTHQIIKEYCNQKVIAVPKVSGKTMDFYQIHSFDELSIGAYSLLEPPTTNFISKQQIDLLIVPMVAFDDKNHRIGYGGGFYDRYLQEYAGKSIGLAYHFQQVETMDVEVHDIPMDVIVTDQYNKKSET